jgi:hypothetical protein
VSSWFQRVPSSSKRRIPVLAASQASRAGVIIEWLKADYDLGRGHVMALVHVIKDGPKILPSMSARTAFTATSPTCCGSTERTATPADRRASPSIDSHQVHRLRRSIRFAFPS